MSGDDEATSLALVLWRLDQLDRARADLPTPDRIQSLERRLSGVESDIEDEQRFRRQVLAGVIVALVAPMVTVIIGIITVSGGTF